MAMTFAINLEKIDFLKNWFYHYLSVFKSRNFYPKHYL